MSIGDVKRGTIGAESQPFGRATWEGVLRQAHRNRFDYTIVGRVNHGHGVGVGIGVPAPVAVVRPACPGPGYTWVDGYYSPAGLWVAGYWAAPVVHVGPAVRFGVRPAFRGYEHFRR